MVVAAGGGADDRPAGDGRGHGVVGVDARAGHGDERAAQLEVPRQLIRRRQLERRAERRHRIAEAQPRIVARGCRRVVAAVAVGRRAPLGGDAAEQQQLLAAQVGAQLEAVVDRAVDVGERAQVVGRHADLVGVQVYIVIGWPESGSRGSVGVVMLNGVPVGRRRGSGCR